MRLRSARGLPHATVHAVSRRSQHHMHAVSVYSRWNQQLRFTLGSPTTCNDGTVQAKGVVALYGSHTHTHANRLPSLHLHTKRGATPGPQSRAPMDPTHGRWVYARGSPWPKQTYMHLT